MQLTPTRPAFLPSVSLHGALGAAAGTFSVTTWSTHA
jgi:hypothetical protein